MASVVDRIKAYLSSPKGHAHVERAKTMARDPRNRRKVQEFVDRWRARRGHH
ncbi:hypothetical protein Sru01_37400 [Sphaerisporangium rufum]|uniref:Uncharacterized protein n=1 Tax=Sphaerisporangium rufum TaxID=1381558 RepID=A0A919R461_9ACTN|nr:hypothetical protein [Sphaerisporangium rufum]GII78758.1 hypothetical protein Sru01_37400 [Sphaerisporangium rufum]